MILNICNKRIDTKDIKSIIIRDTKIIIDTHQEFMNLSYTDPEEIREAQEYLHFKELTENQLIDAASTIMLVCDYYLNEHQECTECPLKRQYGCLIQTAPINWRRNVNRTNETE